MGRSFHLSSVRSKIHCGRIKALLDFQPATGELAPQFREGRRHYAWFRDLTLKEEMEVFSYTKSLDFKFAYFCS